MHRYFAEAGVPLNVVSPEAVMEFFGTYNRTFTRCKICELPRSIERTKFKTINCLVTLLKYCTGASNYKKLLVGLPFLVTTDNVVRVFDSSSPIYASNFSDIMPQASDRFILGEIASVLDLQCGKDNRLCKEFTVSDFAKMLPDLLPAKEFSSAECISTSNLKQYLRSSEGFQWLRRVWRFISSFVPVQQTCSQAAVLKTVEPLRNWYLLPVSSGTEEKLYPVHKASSVLLLEPVSAIFQKYSTIMKKIGVVEPNLSFMFDHKYFDNGVMQIAYEIFGNFEKPISVLLALRDINSHFELKTLNHAECLVILTYFSKNIDHWREYTEASSILKKLPFYLTIYGKVISLEYENIYVLPSQIPQAGMENWTISQKLIFLKEQYNISELLKFLKCRQLSVIDVYCKLIFHHVSILSADERTTHMTFIARYYQTMKIENHGTNGVEFQMLKDNLFRLKFIPSIDGSTLFTASQFFDPRNEVFKIMLNQKSFPPNLTQIQAGSTFFLTSV